MGRELVFAALAGEGLKPDGPDGAVSEWLLNRALEDGYHEPRGLSCALKLEAPLIAVGAPVKTYAPPVAERLGTRLVIPPRAEVANAVGAVVGGVVLRGSALIKPDHDNGSYRLHLPGGMKLFETKQAAVDEAGR